MKKTIIAVILFSFILSFAACGNKDLIADNTTNGWSAAVKPTFPTTGAVPATVPSTAATTITAAIPSTAATTVPVTAQTQNHTGETEPPAKPVISIGQPDPNAKTFTGYKPLPLLKFEVKDPDNTRCLSTKAIGFSWSDAAACQQYYDSKKYNALAVDTKTTQKVLYLTFDCGYENGYTGKILDVLKAKKVPAAFFCTLKGYIDREPELVTRMIKEGHILGNHSYTHPMFPNISRTEMAKEIQAVDDYLRTNFGYSAPYFRFPAGEYSDSALDLVQSLGFKSVFWSVAYRDWETDNQKGKQFAFDSVTKHLHPGAVILLHTVSKDNAEALGDIIDWARAQGYVFKSL